ncbi:SAF domain-containing protein [Paenibacillus sp. J5C_2022]|uniref:SAF domain-containing protein n=1 Tax=Paenibacillus sp. J5C2022 TaxID=2977129 RepID=UPI0021D0B0A9|nr:SAF domain-containing protein [Paenibacillus sp. J5C2022]MCU6712510.1 SAF domain-containing protein [Paenibacillus sp. J5C2022]
MGNKRNMWISLTAAVLSAALVYGLYQLQRQQMQRQDTVAVIVPSRFIAAGEVIAEEDLGIIRLPYSAYTPEMVTEAANVLGMEAAMPLGIGEPMLDWKLDYHALQPRRSESTFQIPREYVRSISNGIRAGDRVAIYASGEEGVSGKVFRETVVVASVKSSGNMEVDGPEKSHLLSMAEGNMDGMYAARRDANAMIEYLNLNLTEQQWLTIDELCTGGATKLVVAYSPESFDRFHSIEERGGGGE